MKRHFKTLPAKQTSTPKLTPKAREGQPSTSAIEDNRSSIRTPARGTLIPIPLSRRKLTPVPKTRAAPSTEEESDAESEEGPVQRRGESSSDVRSAAPVNQGDKSKRKVTPHPRQGRTHPDAEEIGYEEEGPVRRRSQPAGNKSVNRDEGDKSKTAMRVHLAGAEESENESEEEEPAQRSQPPTEEESEDESQEKQPVQRKVTPHPRQGRGESSSDVRSATPVNQGDKSKRKVTPHSRQGRTHNNKVDKTYKFAVRNIGEMGHITGKMLKKIKFYQESTDLLIPKLSFCRLVRGILYRIDPELRLQSIALEALQEATETFIVHYLSDSHLCTHHAKRKTLQVSDMQLIGILKHTPCSL